MPKVLFVCPCIGRFEGSRRYVRSWQMKPLSLGVLAAATPSNWQRELVDDRLEDIDYNIPADLIAITVETFTARRAYQIADEFRRRGCKVVLGGYHPTMCPAEASEHADSICLGRAERIWPEILTDAQADRLQPIYQNCSPDIPWVSPDRTIFAGKNYFALEMVETSRGCPNRCRFCSIAAFYQQPYCRKPINQVVSELKAIRSKVIFFVDDNFSGDRSGTLQLVKAIKPLKKLWITQASVQIARDYELLDAMSDSGCAGVLVGFESSDTGALKILGKEGNTFVDYDQAVQEFHKRGIAIYGTFLLGYDGDTLMRQKHDFEFARRAGLYMAAFNRVVPFPGTGLYQDLQMQGRLCSEAWWLEKHYRFGMLTYNPVGMTRGQVERAAQNARRDFYGWSSIKDRIRKLPLWKNRIVNRLVFIALNAMMRHEQSRFLRPLGLQSSPQKHRHGLTTTKGLRGEVVELSDIHQQEIEELISECSMGGTMEKSQVFPREFKRAIQVLGRERWVLTVRDKNCFDKLIAMGVITRKPIWLNGKQAEMGYLSLLRVHPRWQGRGAMATLYKTFQDQLSHLRADICVTSIFDDNHPARATLLRKHKLWPRYSPLAALECRIFKSRLHHRLTAQPDVHVSHCSLSNRQELIAFLHRFAKTRSLMPVYDENDFNDTGLLAGLNIENVFIARRSGQIVATCALWDQNCTKQHVVSRYRGALRYLRPAVNMALFLRQMPILPSAGGAVSLKHLALATGDDASAFEAVLKETLRSESRETNVVATLPLGDLAWESLSRLPGIRQKSTLYQISRNGSPLPVKTNSSIPVYVEGGSL